VVKSQRVDFEYQLETRTESIGGRSFRLECLASLDATIDDLFDFLSKSNDQHLLEELCPYFGTVWPSARALAEELASEPPASLEERAVLELGCGLALPSLLAASRGAIVTATDSHPDIEAFLRRNLAGNGLEVCFRKLDWTKEEPALGRFDWVVGSDVLYERHQPKVVAGAIHRHLAPGGVALLTDPGRPYLQEFADEMKALGYSPQLSTRVVADLTQVGKKEIFTLRFEAA
jgi:predicted nicotinamide N-methyase